jgi:hypothetical protein
LTETLVPPGTSRRKPDDVHPAYRAHPLLDPHLPAHNPAATRLWVDAWHRLRDDDAAYLRILKAYTQTPGGTQPAAATFSQYFHDADSYLLDLLRLVPESLARHLVPLPETRGLSALRDLLRMTFEGRDARSRYEAQRKLYLAKMLFDVDHCRSIRDGLRHRARFEEMLRTTIFSGVEDTGEVEICGLVTNGHDGAQRLEIGVRPTALSRCWRFRVRHLPAQGPDAAVDVYHYRSRHKREADPAIDGRTDEGLLALSENPRWPGLGRRSGSILSKMIRRGIADPRQVQDVLGAMFIVGDRRQAYALERRLMYALGGPLRWRDRVDTLSSARDRALLDPQSSSGFLVLKEIVDVLMEDPSSETPYLFSVEIQIYPLEAYLRTLCDAHFASHTAYKKRQFLNELLPLLFPSALYGGAALRFD